MRLTTYLFKKVFILFLLSALTACAWSAEKEKALCPINLSSPINNFCEVTPKILWRGAKPNEEDATWLVKTGVKTIINLELLYDDLDTLESVQTAKNSLYIVDYFRVRTWEPFYAFAKNKADEDVIEFLAIAKQAKLPIYVHCRAGENRTGVMVAAYKIILENQTSSEQIATVINEMQSYKGFWSDETTAYIKDLANRRKEILEKVKTTPVQKSIQIIYDNGKAKRIKQP